MSHDQTDEKKLLGSLDHAFDLVYHDIKEAMHAEQHHHGFETHPYDLEPHVEDDPLAIGQHGFYEGTAWPTTHHFAPRTNGLPPPVVYGEGHQARDHARHHKMPKIEVPHVSESDNKIIDSETFHGVYHELSPYHSMQSSY